MLMRLGFKEGFSRRLGSKFDFLISKMYTRDREVMEEKSRI